MKLFLDNRVTRVEFDGNEEVGLAEQSWLVPFLTFEDSANSFYMADGKAGYSGTTRRMLFNFRLGGFPSGLTGMVYRGALKHRFNVDVQDMRKWPDEPLGRDTCAWLYDFQHDAVDRLLSRTRGVLSVPTGGGKTEIACGLMMRTPNVRWLLLAPEADLMLNAANRWEKRTGEEAGLLGDGKDTHEGKRIVCATFQTVSRRLSDPHKRHQMEEFLKSFQGVIVDEVHQCPADSNYGVLTAMPNAFYRCGLSGTALSRTDRRNMYTIAAIGDVVYEIKPQLLMEKGFIARPNIRFVPHTMKPPKNKTWQGAYRELITNCKQRNELIVKVAENAKKPCLVFVKHEKHGKALEKMLKARGNCSAEFVYGKHSTSQREKAIEKLSWGDLDIAICSKIWQTGTDIPELRSLVIGTGGASAIETIQRVGRALRVVRDADGKVLKDSADIWDIFDKDGKAINPDTKRKNKTKASWFEDHSNTRKAHYLANGYPVQVLEEADCVKFLK